MVILPVQEKSLCGRLVWQLRESVTLWDRFPPEINASALQELEANFWEIIKSDTQTEAKCSNLMIFRTRYRTVSS